MLKLKEYELFGNKIMSLKIKNRIKCSISTNELIYFSISTLFSYKVI